MKAQKCFSVPRNNNLFAVLQMTEKCNLNCKYCYIPGRSNITMSLSVAFATVDYFSSLSNKKVYDSVTLCFHGGEPLLNLNFLKNVVKYAQKKGINKFVIGTNGTKFNVEIIKFLIKNHISPTFSLDGIKIAHNKNRVFSNGRGSWVAADHALELFSPYSHVFNGIRIPDPFRIRLSFTPETISFLSKSVIYLASKKTSKDFFINLMPVNPYHSSWDRLYKSGELDRILENEFMKIAKFYIQRIAKKVPFNICINECLMPEWSDFLNFYGLYKFPSCGLGKRLLGISWNGKIFPCHLFAANYRGNEEFCIGDVFKGIDNDKIPLDFCYCENNEFFSCLYWNYMATGKSNLPALAFRSLYEAWKGAIIYIKNNPSYIKYKKSLTL